MKDKVLCILHEQWIGLVGVAISIASLVISVHAIRRDRIMRNQQEQERLYREIEALLELKKSKYQRALDQVRLGAFIAIGQENEMDRIMRETNRYFGKTIYRRLCRIINLCKKAEEYNGKLAEYINAIQDYENGEAYKKLQEALIAEAEGRIDLLKDQSMTKMLNEMILFSQNDECDTKERIYDFSEIYKKHTQIRTRISIDTDKLKKQLNKCMMKR